MSKNLPHFTKQKKKKKKPILKLSYDYKIWQFVSRIICHVIICSCIILVCVYTYIWIIVVGCIFFIYFLEFSEESTIYSDLKVHCSSNTQNGKITKTSKTKGKKHLKL